MMSQVMSRKPEGTYNSRIHQSGGRNETLGGVHSHSLEMGQIETGQRTLVGNSVEYLYAVIVNQRKGEHPGVQWSHQRKS